MIDTRAVRYASRSRLLTLSVCTTGAIPLAATGQTYTRTTGSFLTDGFADGMELVASGFAQANNNGTAVIEQVSALVMTVDRDLTTETAADGRTLAVGLPSTRVWENEKPTKTVKTGTLYFEEKMLPSPFEQVTNGLLEALPMYLPRLHFPGDLGMEAPSRYATALLRHFLPGTPISLAGDTISTLVVRGDFGPSVGELIDSDTAGFKLMPATVPLRYRTFNSI